MSRAAISASGAAAIGPYSHGMRANGFVYLSGQTPVDPSTGKLVPGDISAQLHQCFKNLQAVLQAGGLGFADVIKVNVFLISMDDFAALNAIYTEYFTAPYPARTTIGVAALPLNAAVEIEMIALDR